MFGKQFLRTYRTLWKSSNYNMFHTSVILLRHSCKSDQINRGHEVDDTNKPMCFTRNCRLWLMFNSEVWLTVFCLLLTSTHKQSTDFQDKLTLFNQLWWIHMLVDTTRRWPRMGRCKLKWHSEFSSSLVLHNPPYLKAIIS